jgi:hypothetical protein
MVAFPATGDDAPQEGQAKRNVAFVDRIKEEQFNSS